MSKLADFMNAQKTEPRKGMEVDFDVNCQVCFEFVGCQEYFHVEKLLKWTCSNGHVSYVEEFRV